MVVYVNRLDGCIENKFSKSFKIITMYAAWYTFRALMLLYPYVGFLMRQVKTKPQSQCS